MNKADCAYCAATGDHIVWANEQCRVVLVTDSPLVGWCRVIWNDHRRELTDLSVSERTTLMAVTFAVETGLRTLLSPDKMNLASLGTGLPHVHWHVIPRFFDDTHFPEPVWTAPLRGQSGRALPEDFSSKLAACIKAALGV